MADEDRIVPDAGLLVALVRPRRPDEAVASPETGLAICVGGPLPVPIRVVSAAGTFTAANDDELDFVSVSSSMIEPVPDTPWFRFTSQDRIVPTGTGRFAEATGSVATVVTFDPTVTPVQAVFTLHGTITIPKR